MSKVVNDLKDVLKRLEEDPAPPVAIDRLADGCEEAFPSWTEPLKKFLEEQDKNRKTD